MRSKAIIVFLAMCYLYLILTTTKNGNPTILQLVLFKDTNTRKELVSAVDRVGQSITILFHKINPTTAVKMVTEVVTTSFNSTSQESDSVSNLFKFTT